MLIVLAGLPGTGKTTLARRLCERLAAFHLRIDTIEAALKRSGCSGTRSAPPDMGSPMHWQPRTWGTAHRGRQLVNPCG